MSDLSWVAEKATGILIPSGYKAGKLYGIVPQWAQDAGTPANAFDFTFARSSIATRTNEAGLIETMAIDVPRLQYPSCPSCLLESARSNLFLNSDIGVTQTLTLVSGSVYSMYFFEGTGSIDLTGAHTATLTASDHAYSGAITFTAATTSLVCTVTGAANLVQCELGTYPTTYIKTEAAAANRAVDDMSLSGLQTNGILGATEGTWYVDFKDFYFGASENIYYIGGTETTGALSLRRSLPTSWFFRLLTPAGVTLSGQVNKGDKAAVKWDGGTYTAFINGVLDQTTAAQPVYAFDNCNTGINTNHFSELNQMHMYPAALTDAQLIELTS